MPSASERANGDRLGELRSRLTLPLICAPMFLVSGPDLVIAACRSGIIGAFPAPNARPVEVLDAWMTRVARELDDAARAEPGRRIAPWSLNLVVHSSYERLKDELELVRRHRPPIVITALGNPARAVETVHGLRRPGVRRRRQPRDGAQGGAGGRGRADPRLRRGGRTHGVRVAVRVRARGATVLRRHRRAGWRTLQQAQQSVPRKSPAPISPTSARCS